MKITEIKVTKAGRYFLISEGMGLFSLHPDSYAMESIQVGDDIPVEQLEELRLRDERYSAKQKAFDLLTASEQTSGMLRQKLSRFYGEEAIEETISRMEELHLVDDEDYAQRAARDMVFLKKYSLGRVRAELLKKGLTSEQVQTALAQFSDEEEVETAAAILKKQYLKKLELPDGQRKVMAALQRRGFAYDTIRKALAQISIDPEDD